MSTKQVRRVLFVDNHRDFLDTRAEFLEAEGYQVLKAYSLEEAREAFHNQRVHLAILDVRMINDEDDKDTSGLMLAKDPEFRPVPKIILTDYPDYRSVREALGAALDGLPPAIDFLAKPEGPEAMIRAVETAFVRYIHSNAALIIRWREPSSFLHLAHLIDAQAGYGSQAERAEELADLFYKLFFEYVQITIGRLLLRRANKIVIEVFAYTAEKREMQFIVACGLRQAIVNEKTNFSRFASNTGELGNTVVLTLAETVHYGAILYQLAGGDLATMISFAAFYQSRQTGEVLTALDQLYLTLLAPWHAQGRSNTELSNGSQFFQEWLEKYTGISQPSLLAQKMSALCSETFVAGLSWLDYTARQLTFHLPDGGLVHLPNPLTFILNDQLAIKAPLLYGVIHGGANVDDILIDPQGHTWLIDFTHTGRGLVTYDFVSLELAIKLGLLEVSGLEARYEFEKDLLAVTDLHALVIAEGFGAELAKPLRAIEHIRRLTTTVIGPDPESYWLTLLYCALARIVIFDPAIRYTRQELIPFAHCLLLAALLCEKLNGDSTTSVELPVQARNNLWVDEGNRVVWVEGRQVELTPQEFNLLLCLYKNRGQLCPRPAIIEVIGGDISGDETSRINSALSRLRQKIESDPEHPKYIITVRGYGYKLM